MLRCWQRECDGIVVARVGRIDLDVVAVAAVAAAAAHAAPVFWPAMVVVSATGLVEVQQHW
eukprot:6533136-Alexandrium_andersonii.AAC.1